MSESADPPAAAPSGSSGRNTAAIAILILAASVSTARLLIHAGLPVAHDMVFHLFQADQFQNGLVSGEFLPRWAMSANNGYGAPNFIFYAPLSYYFASLIRVFMPSPVISLIIAIWCSFFFSGAFMYLAVKRCSGDRGALAAALLYQLLPFHLLNLYGRGAFAELCAYAWFPLVILFMHETLSDKRSPLASAGLSLSYAGLILTHLVSGLIFSIVLFLYTACRHYLHRSGKALLRALTALVAGLGISSFYLIPVIFERKYVHLEYMFNYVFSDYRDNFLFMKKNLDAPFYVTLNGAATLELLLFITLVFISLKSSADHSRRAHHAAIAAIFISAFFLATPLSAPLWAFFPSFALLQFPWRWLSAMEISLCFLVGALLSETNLRSLFHNGLTGKTAVYSMLALFSLSLLLILKSDRMHKARFLEMITDAEQVRHYTNLPKEYTPIWATNVENTIREENIDKVSSLSGKADIRILRWRPETRAIGVNAPSPVRLRIATFFYPGWEAGIDGIKTGIAIEEKTGAMLVDLPGGEHTLEMTFVDTPLRVFSRYLSYGSCAILAIFSLFSLRKRIEAFGNQIYIPPPL